MRAGRDGAGQGLHVDVALVLNAQPEIGQRLPEIVDFAAGADRSLAGGGIGRLDALQAVERQQDLVGRVERGERMAGTGHAHDLPLAPARARSLRLPLRLPEPAIVAAGNGPSPTSSTILVPLHAPTANQRSVPPRDFRLATRPRARTQERSACKAEASNIPPCPARKFAYLEAIDAFRRRSRSRALAGPDWHDRPRGAMPAATRSQA